MLNEFENELVKVLIKKREHGIAFISTIHSCDTSAAIKTNQDNIMEFLNVLLRATGNEARYHAIQLAVEKVMLRPENEWSRFTVIKEFKEIEQEFKEIDPQVSIEAGKCVDILNRAYFVPLEGSDRPRGINILALPAPKY